MAVECQSINKNQSLIKIKPVVREKNAKSEENFETLQLAAEYYGLNKNQSLIKMKPVVPEKIAKKWRKFGNFTIGCRVTQHEQKSKFVQDQTSSSWDKRKREQNFETLQLTAECLGINKNQSLIKIRPVVPEKMPKTEKLLKLYNYLQSVTA